MKQFDGKEFMNTALGKEAAATAAEWDEAIEREDIDPPFTMSLWMKKSEICEAKWRVIDLAIVQFYGENIYFIRRKQYYGVRVADEWLLKVERKSRRGEQP